MNNPSKDVPVTMNNASNYALNSENVTMRFGSVIALQDVSMHVDQGSVTCVLGNNGAGKLT